MPLAEYRQVEHTTETHATPPPIRGDTTPATSCILSGWLVFHSFLHLDSQVLEAAPPAMVK
jgi:hypothetical protein